MGFFKTPAEREAARLRKIQERAAKNSAATIKKANAAKEMRERTGAGPNYKGPRCPQCGSIDFQLLGNSSKPLSAGKAFVGDMIAGPSGAIIGAAMGKKGKYQVMCTKCGKRFEFK